MTKYKILNLMQIYATDGCTRQELQFTTCMDEFRDKGWLYEYEVYPYVCYGLTPLGEAAVEKLLETVVRLAANG